MLTVAVLLALRVRPSHETAIVGAVLTADSDPRKQMPIPDVHVTATAGGSTSEATSDSSGLFRFSLRPGVKAGTPITLTFNHREYKPLESTETVGSQLYIERMTPILHATASKKTGPETTISDLRIRYTVKVGSNIDVGTVVKTFEAVNKGNVPCKGGPVCSPDGKWRASVGSLTIEAPEASQFRDVRVSCIAGPCPFTRIESDNRDQNDRRLRISARNWSDTATFLVEADVVHTVISDMVRQSYPVKFGRGMSFTLPGTAGGPSIEAEVNGSSSYIVYPLGPDLLLSWANCTLSVNPDQSKLYSCELKPGFRFQ
jgi:hypothetical protein